MMWVLVEYCVEDGRLQYACGHDNPSGFLKFNGKSMTAERQPEPSHTEKQEDRRVMIARITKLLADSRQAIAQRLAV